MKKYTFREHFYEIKKRLLRVFFSFIIIFSICYIFSENLYKIIFSPLVDIIGIDGSKIIYTGLTEAFFSYIKVSAFFAFIIVLPLCCYQIYLFIEPGLHSNEKKLVFINLFLSPVLFYAGCFFMFYIVMPNAWKFFASYQNDSLGIPLVLEARISEYLNLFIQVTFAFGIAFQLPIFIVIINVLGFIKSDSLIKKRRFAVVSIFIVAAIITPPDVFSQIALAIPLLLLYEISIVLCKYLEKRNCKLC